jgi:hypothetical protein
MQTSKDPCCEAGNVIHGSSSIHSSEAKEVHTVQLDGDLSMQVIDGTGINAKSAIGIGRI